MEIRPVDPSEHARLGALTVDAYRAVHDPDGMDEYATRLRDVAGRAADADVLVAVDGDGTLLGGVTYVPGPWSSWAEFSDPAGAGIRMLAVAAGVQGRGVGEALVRACIERARSGGRDRVLLHSTGAMAVAHRLYLRLGFERDPGLDWAPVPGLRLRGFRLELRSG